MNYTVGCGISDSVGESMLFICYYVQDEEQCKQRKAKIAVNIRPTGEESGHGLINYIDTKAKCRHLKKLTCKGTLRSPCFSKARADN